MEWAQAGASKLAHDGKSPSDVLSVEPKKTPSVSPRAGSSPTSYLSPQDRVICFTLLFAVSFVEGADLQLLPASFRALEAELGFSPSDLALTNLFQALAYCFSAPIWGLLVDRGVPAKNVLITGTCAWGLFTLLLACVWDLRSMLMLRILNGMALSSLSPVAQSVIAELTSQEERGRFFGMSGFCSGVGAMVSATLTAGISGLVFAKRIHGWRIAFAIVAVISVVLSSLLATYMEEPRRYDEFKRDSSPVFSGEDRNPFSLLSYFRIRTFAVIVVQGCFGCIPWSALSFQTMLYQYEGISNLVSGSLTSLVILGCAFGQMIGGHVGDALASRTPLHGRALTAQISSFSGIPLAFVMFHLLPRDPTSAPWYAAVGLLFGLLACWCESGVNRPLLIELVHPNHRARVVTVLQAFSGSAGAVGAPFVGLVAEHFFGYQTQQKPIDQIPLAERQRNAEALARSLFMMTVLPWLFCFLSYGLLHWTYPRDIEDLEKEMEGDGAHRESEPLVTHY